MKKEINRKKLIAIIVNGLDKIGVEMAEILIEKGYKVIFIDKVSKENEEEIKSYGKRVILKDYSYLEDIDSEIENINYVLFFAHKDFQLRTSNKIVNYTEILLANSSKFKAKFLLLLSANEIVRMEQEVYNLTKEYISKIKMDGRVVKIPTMLGDGMNFLDDAPITKLILSGAKDGDILIPKNGMQKIKIINLKDVVVGLTKILFSRITTGKEYYLANQNETSLISVAYKIQESGKTNREIKFYENLENKKDIKLNNDSLEDIGFSTKISLEQSISESLSSAKIYLLEKGEIQNDKPKLLSQSPLTRLVVERKRIEESLNRTSGLEKKNNRRLIRLPKLTIWPLRDFIQDQIRKIKNASVRKKLFYSILFSIFLFFYFAIVSPAVLITKNIIVINSSYNSVIDGIGASDNQLIDRSVKDTLKAVSELKLISENYFGIISLFFGEKNAIAIKDLFENLVLMNRGFIEYSNLYTNFENLIKNNISNYQNNKDNEGYINIEKKLNLNQDKIDNVVKSVDIAMIGSQRIESSFRKLSEIERREISEPLKELIRTISKEFRKIESNLINPNLFTEIPSIFGAYEQKNYVLLLLNNEKRSAIGGEISGVCEIVLDQGNINKFNCKPVEELKWSLSLGEKSKLKEYFNKNELLSLNDIGILGNDKKYFEIFSEIWKLNRDSVLNGIIYLDDRFLSDMIFHSGSKSIIIDGMDSSKINVLNESINNQFRTKLYSEVFINTLKDEFELKRLIDSVSNNFLNGSIRIFIPETRFGDLANNKISITPILIGDSKKGDLNIESNILFIKDGLVSIKIKSTRPEGSTFEKTMFCLPKETISSSISLLQGEKNNFVTKEISEQKCVEYTYRSDNNFEVGFNIDRNKETVNGKFDLIFERIRSGGGNLKLRIEGEQGVVLTSDTLEIENNIIDENLSLSTNSLINLTIRD